MFLLIKLTILFFILSITTLSVSAEEISKISEETFKEMEHPPSSINEKTRPESLMATELADRSPKTTNTKALDAS